MKEQSVQTPTVSVATEIVGLINSSATRVNQLSAVLTKDPVLMHTILKKANASAYGIRDRVSDLNLAIILIGFDVLKKTIASTLINDAMRKIVDVLSKYDDFWQHAMKTALYAQTLARETGKCDPSAAFTAGLLHDIGHLLKKLGSAEFEKLMSGQDIVLPTDTHAEWGALLGGKWNLPLTIIEAIRFHHMPELAQTDVSLVSAVHMADYLSSEEEGFEYEEEILRCSLFACTTLGVDSKIMENPDQVEIFKTMKAHSMASTDALFSAAMKNTIIDALASLPEEERVVVALRYYDTLGFHEIGQLCGYDMKTAEMLHNKAISRLKNMFLPEKLQGE